MHGLANTTGITKQDDGYYIRKWINGKQVYLGFGTTLIIALMKLDWCKANNWQKYPQTYEYIVKRGKDYLIRKWINGKIQYFGTFKTYEEAVDERDLLIKYDWDIGVLCDLNE